MSKKNKKAEDVLDSSEENLETMEDQTTENADNQEDTVEEPVIELSPEEQLEQDNVELKQQVGELKDKYLRVFSDFENFRKRNMRERLELMKNAAQDTMSAILPVLDDFDRAKKSADMEGSEEQFSEGVELVYQKLYRVLEGKGLKVMESTGEAFDAELHEAITEIPAPIEEMKGKVIDTVEKGYFLNDKIIRHAKVVVGK